MEEVRITSLIAQLNDLSKEYACTEDASEQRFLELTGCNLSYNSSYKIPREPPRGRHFSQMLQVSTLDKLHHWS
jgi:hypothetical protein